MAERRMFSKKVTDSDAFIEMPSATQALYFHLNQAADDDGFNNQIQVAMMKSHAGVDDLKILMMKSFIIRFESGVIVIKHWRMHNVLRKDRYTPTSFQEELAQLNIKENQSYTLSDVGCQMVAKRLPQDRLGKVRLELGKDSIEGEEPPSRTKFIPPTIEEVKAYCTERNRGVKPEKWIAHYQANGWMVGRTKMKDWKAAVRTWERGDDDERFTNNAGNNGSRSGSSTKPTYGDIL